MQKRLSLPTYIDGIVAQNRFVLSRAITLVESENPADNALAQELIESLLPRMGNSLRIGITGVPGVGKSTFIEHFGKLFTQQGKKLAVLAVDPTSQKTKGSIMGDKTRMETLVNDPFAYIRPSPSGNSLGGVSRKTRESMLLCEAAGFEVIFIETVGVGQSETSVAGMTDFFLLLMLAGAGDELQGIKKGIMEMADGIAITKADGGNETKAKIAKADYQNALHLFPLAESHWNPQVMTCSALSEKGLPEVKTMLEKYQEMTVENGFFAKKRQQQQLQWLHDTISHELLQQFYNNPNIKTLLATQETLILNNQIHPVRAALALLKQT